jgi:hypothetical protein
LAVTVICGADEQQLDILVGLEYATAVEVARSAMSIPDDIVDVRLNNTESTISSRNIRDGDVITFYKRAGTKGL